MFDKISKFIGGNIGQFAKDAASIVDRFVQTKDEKSEIKRALIELAHKQEMEVQEKIFEAEHEFNERIKDMEGTAKDLNQSGWAGKFVLFLRGAQRPLWGYAVIYMDFMIFSGRWAIPEENPQLQNAFWIINFLVLGFLFGERAVKNVGPLVAQMFQKK